MRVSLGTSRPARLGVAMLALAAAGSTGCQVQVGGQALPSGYYQADDVQYFAPGPEFKLANEAAALKAREQAAALQAADATPRPGWTAPKWR